MTFLAGGWEPSFNLFSIEQNAITMKNIKSLLVFITFVSILVLASSGCQKEKTTKWRCALPQWKCNVELIVDNAADLAYVTVDYAEGYAPNPRVLFRHSTTYKKSGNNS